MPQPRNGAGMYPRPLSGPLDVRMFRKLLLIVSLALPMAAWATDAVPPVVQQALSRLAGQAEVSHVEPAPIPGFYQALVHGRIVYISNDGKYVMAGQLFDAQAAVNLTEAQMNAIRRNALASVPASQRIIFAPPHPKYTVTVFTDLDCAYCRVLHEHIKQYNDEGIAVQYLFWPRSGIKTVPGGRDTPSYAKSVSVWCSADRKKAFTDAKRGESIPPKTCPNPVASEFRLGRSIGVDGTPTVIAEDGSVIGGYLPPEQMLEALRVVHFKQVMKGAPGAASASAP